jgi:hypothetical protein
MIPRRNRSELKPIDAAIEVLRHDLTDRAKPADCHT